MTTTAKSKPADAAPEIEPATPAEAPPAEPTPEQAEIAKLRAELEEAKARVAAAEAKASPAAPDLSGPMRKFIVSLQYADTFVVEAPHESLAFEAYKRASGVIRSDYSPEVREASPDAKLGKVRKTFP
jgi:hypothetical protein